MKKWLPLLLVLFLAGCKLMPGLGGASGSVETVGQAEEIVINNGLLWWQWIIIGMLIPSPWEIVGSMFRAWKRASTGGLL